jgi:hypothetical protein
MDARVAASGKGFWRLAVIVSARARLKAGTTLTDGAGRVQRARQQATR